MSKSAEAFRTISEVAEALDTPAHVLRFWESRFSQVRPVKRAGGRRYYRPSDVALLGGIRRLLHEDGLTIRGVQKILREKGVRHVAGLAGEGFEEPAEEAPARLNGSEREAGDGIAATRAAEKSAETAAERQRDLFAAAGAEAGPGASDDAVSEAPMEIDAVPQPQPGASVAVPIFQARPPSGAAAGRGEAGPEDDGPTLAARLRALDPARAAARREELSELYSRLAGLRDRLARRS